MKVLLSWLRDFVDVPVGAPELADTLAMRGFEVASVESTDADAVIDVEITANRPDCLSVRGLAREVSTTYDVPLRSLGGAVDAPLGVRALETGEDGRLKVTLDAPDLCPRYAAAVAEVRIAPSPAWMAARLEAAGIRPINNVVDVTNYVLAELGHPLHAFDLERLAGRELRIRRARSGEPITTLDAVARALTPDVLVIADAERAQAVAGVMGGGGSEVTAATRRVALESAYFDPVSVRRTSKRLGLKTEASARFERGADIAAPVVALERACALLERIGAGRAGGIVIDRYPAPRAAAALHLRRTRIRLLLGEPIADGEVERILRGLAFDLAPDAEGWRVTVPSARVDVRREVDLLEELARHHGYDRLAPTYPPPNGPAPAPDVRIPRDRRVRQVLLASGLSEAMTFAFIEAEAAHNFVADRAELVSIANPLSAKFAVLRPSLIAGLVDAVAHNRRHGRRTVALFEIGNRFTATEGETRVVACAWTGAAVPEHWSGSGREVDFFDTKGVLERLGEALELPVRCEPAERPYLVPGQGAVVLIDGDGLDLVSPRRPPLSALHAPRSAAGAIGIVGQLAPQIGEARGLPRADKVFVAEMNLDAVWHARREGRGARGGLTPEGRAQDEAVRALPRVPSVARDLAILIDETLPAAAVRGTIRSAGPDFLTSVQEFDRFTGQGVPPGRVSLALHLVFQAPDRTLTDADVQRAMDRIIAALATAHGAERR